MASAYSRRKFMRPWTVAIAAALIAAGVGVAVPSTAWSGAEASAPNQPEWLDSGNSVDRRVDALLKELTLRRLERQLARRLRFRSRLLHGKSGSDPAGEHGADRHPRGRQ
jgi:hypothetical protein